MHMPVGVSSTSAYALACECGHRPCQHARTALAITATVLAITASALAITCHRPRHHRRRALAVYKILALLRCSR